ncbi:MAG TPA: DUF6084 family protein [Planctomycetota bacterium]|nr:DUF6084 family protein [Planctomycetota bacterium]
MPDLKFHLEGVDALRHAVSPHLGFRLTLEQGRIPPLLIQNILLHVQIQIEPQRRTYDPAARERLGGLFGREEQGIQTLQNLLWTHVDVVVPSFVERTTVELSVPCSYDFNIAVTRYFDGLEDGDVPLRLLFSGTIFHAGEDGSLQVALIPWEKELLFRLPVRTWKTLMHQHYAGSAWLRLEKAVFDRLLTYKRRAGLTSWDGTVQQLLDAVDAGSRSMNERDGEIVPGGV